jgi:hypothetical protein|tara:strand:- start:548 stop:664 length:117 start_codon:yes stop_codon:yes gene_type:complete
MLWMKSADMGGLEGALFSSLFSSTNADDGADSSFCAND